MARARNIKPDFFTDEDIVELHPLTRLMFIGMWTLADRKGRMEDRPKQIKLRLLPADDHNVEDALNELVLFRFIERYQVNGKHYIQIRNFTKHQNPHRDEKQSEIPPPNNNLQDAPCNHDAGTMQTPCKHDAKRPDSLNLIPDSLNLIPDSLTTTEEGERADACACARDQKMSMSEIQELYITYVGKIPHNQPIASSLLDICRKYPPERIRMAFKAVVEVNNPNLNWVRKFLDNPHNWHETSGLSSRGSPKTFEQIKLDNIKKAIRGAMDETGGLEGIQFTDG
jgi:hypothetical protein